MSVCDDSPDGRRADDQCDRRLFLIPCLTKSCGVYGALMTKPCIHLNGTSAAELERAYSAAYSAVQLSIDAVAATGPNGRDYYPLGAEAMESAQNEHASRMAALGKIEQELLELLMHCEGAAS